MERGDIRLIRGDCLEELRKMPEGSIDLVLTDPPYNGRNATQKNGKRTAFDWDWRPDYIDWCIEWLTECQRILKPTGVLYFWHNDIATIAELLEAIRQRTSLELISFCIWDKGDAYRGRTWENRDPDGATALRAWFNVCEYCLHFFSAPGDADKKWGKTGTDRIMSSPECFRPIKEWYRSELDRLGIAEKDIAEKYTEATGRKPYMLRHYFRDSQFEIPTRQVWETVYMPLGFGKEYEALRKEYEALRKEYEALRKEYEALRNYHRCDARHCNIWHVPPIPSNNRLHTCQKPVEILSRLIRVSCPEGGTVLDCFMGSGSTAVSCMDEGRKFVGIEKDRHCFDIAARRVGEHWGHLPGNSRIEKEIAARERQMDISDLMA